MSFAASLRSRGAGRVFSSDSKQPNEEQNCARNDEMFANIVPSNQKQVGIVKTEKSQEFSRACEDSCWNQDKSTPCRSDTSGIAENAVRKVKEGTSALLVQPGLSEQWSGEAMECFCYVRRQTGRYKVTV